MRRIRSSEPGAHVLFEAGAKKLGKGVTVTVPEQVAIDGDVRKLLDDIRKDLGDELRGKSTPSLEPTWGIEPISGTASMASTAITLNNPTAPDYIDRVFDATEARVVPALIEEWAKAAIPESGDGVGTEPGVDTSGGPLPR